MRLVGVPDQFGGAVFAGCVVGASGVVRGALDVVAILLHQFARRAGLIKVLAVVEFPVFGIEHQAPEATQERVEFLLRRTWLSPEQNQQMPTQGNGQQANGLGIVAAPFQTIDLHAERGAGYRRETQLRGKRLFLLQGAHMSSSKVNIAMMSVDADASPIGLASPAHRSLPIADS